MALTISVSGWVRPIAIQASRSSAWSAVLSFMCLGTVTAPGLLFARPREMTKSLAAVASLLFDLVVFNAAYVLLSKD